jgi:Zn-dependent M28 family amino/carboxypeptidase
MNKLTIAGLLLGSVLLSSAAPKQALYQVISSHPHDVKEFTPYIQTVKQEGRLWLVHLNGKVPADVMKNFRRTNGLDVKHYTAPVMKSAFASPMIKDFISRIDVPSIKSDVETLSNYKTRLVGTADNQKATAQIKGIFAALGYTVSEYCYRPGACSVVADKVGDGSSNEVIMILGHLDSVGKNFAGADDNASGAAVLMEVARVLKDYSNKKTLRFFATNGEESGLHGAEHYADLLKKSGEIKRISLAINMDMVGYNSNGIVELETDSQYEKLANWFAGLATTYTTLKSKITLGAWGSDHVPFIKGGVPTLLTIEDWSTKTPCYHQACDKPNTLNYEYAGEIAKLNLAAIMTKDAE